LKNEDVEMVLYVPEEFAVEGRTLILGRINENYSFVDCASPMLGWKVMSVEEKLFSEDEVNEIDDNIETGFVRYCDDVCFVPKSVQKNNELHELLSDPEWKLVTAWAETCRGPGFVNRVVWVLFHQSGTMSYKVVALQPEEQNERLVALFDVSSACSASMVSAVLGLEKLQESIDRRIPLEKKQSISCRGFWESTTDGKDFDCEYEYAGEISCEDCLVNGGPFDPRVGRRREDE
jgi:hypothetical protein